MLRALIHRGAGFLKSVDLGLAGMGACLGLVVSTDTSALGEDGLARTVTPILVGDSQLAGRGAGWNCERGRLSPFLRPGGSCTKVVLAAPRLVSFKCYVIYKRLTGRQCSLMEEEAPTPCGTAYRSLAPNRSL